MMRLFLGLLICAMIGHVSLASAIVAKQASKPAGKSVSGVLVPHRAVYEISLANKKEAVSVSNVRGRMVFEITGSPCDGYTQNMRMITSTTDERGVKSLSDIRSSTWEQGRGKRLRFSSSQYLDSQLQEVVSGDARRSRNGKNISVKVDRPGATVLDIPGDALFPAQHSLAIIRAAKAGKKQLDVRIYDGSEQGQGFYKTYSFIGKKIPAIVKGPNRNRSKKSRKKAKKLARLGLAKLPSWPVAVSYFNGEGNSDDTIPSYELSFRMYPNGVSGNLLINYGNFSVRGRLDKIKYLRAGSCKHKKRNR